MNREEAEAQLETLVKWSAAREVQTKRGPKILRKAEPSEAFWNAWRVGREQLKALGISCGRNDFEGGKWEVCWWRDIPKEVADERAASVAASRATDAEIDVPVPDGLAYMPFQRAGIRFALRQFGVAVNGARNPQHQTEKGGMPTPSRGDSGGVLIADEMG